ncbi:MAG: DUF2807 domain-containing protein [Bacteroidetes bacterium]|nr:DUF2807 domain-containing protein [Bacteroidota bacterium]
MKTITKAGLILLFVGIVMSLPAQRNNRNRVSGSGNLEKETRKVPPFDALDISNAFDVYLTQGNKESLVIEADDNILKHIYTEVVGGKLRIYIKGNIRRIKTMRAYISFKMLDEIELSGAVEIHGENAMKFENLMIDASGASEIYLKLTAAKVNLDLSGASDIEFTGSANELVVDASGASDIKAIDFEVDDCILEASGACSVKVFVNRNLEVDASGASTVRYKGSPSVEIDVSGVSSVKRY